MVEGFRNVKSIRTSKELITVTIFKNIKCLIRFEA